MGGQLWNCMSGQDCSIQCRGPEWSGWSLLLGRQSRNGSESSQLGKNGQFSIVHLTGFRQKFVLRHEAQALSSGFRCSSGRANRIACSVSGLAEHRRPNGSHRPCASVGCNSRRVVGHCCVAERSVWISALHSGAGTIVSYCEIKGGENRCPHREDGRLRSKGRSTNFGEGKFYLPIDSPSRSTTARVNEHSTLLELVAPDSLVDSTTLVIVGELCPTHPLE